MKPRLLLPPVAALAVAGIWLGSQHRSISALEKETVLLREHLAAARSSEQPADDRSLAGARSNGKTKEPDAIDWKELADTMAKAQRGGMPDMRSMMKLQAKLMNMSGAEIVAALDEIAALELSEEARQGLESTLIGLLAQKDPKLALDRFLDRLDDPQGSMSWQLASAFQQWAGKDSAAAIAWFDTQIAAGKFDSRSLDGKSQVRLRFEAAVVGTLMTGDPDAAGKRIAALPEDQRRDLFQQGMFLNLKPGSAKAFATLVREHVPAAEQASAFASTTSMMMHQGGYEKVGTFLDEIGATPAERRAISAQAAGSKMGELGREGKVDREAIDTMRVWVAMESPDSVDAITGEALGSIWDGRTKFEDTVKQIEELHAESGSDDLLVAFLNGGQARQHKEAALALAEKISDETKRATVIGELGGKPAVVTDKIPVR